MERVDLDAYERELERRVSAVFMAQGRSVVAELRAAREVVKTVRAARLNPLNGPVRGWVAIGRAVATYDQTAGRPDPAASHATPEDRHEH